MPVTYTEEYMGGLYRLAVRDPSHPQFRQRVGYTRAAFVGPNGRLDMYEARADKLIAAVPLQASTRILIVGQGLGFLNEALLGRGYRNVEGCDNGPYLTNRQSEMAGRVRSKFQPVAVANVTGGPFDVVVTEDVVGGYSVAELPAFLAQCAAVSSGPVVHLVSCARPDPAGGARITGDTSLTWLYIEEWAAFAPSHIWIQTNGGS